ncbi:MAG: hypothetical protein LIP09_05445 [Bacteroidales bacterium]|nr:hypothetical protein [Bacteroidales bacterium]
MNIFKRILWIVGLLAWTICFALGFNYGHSDSLMVSIILMVAVLAIMGIDIFLLNKWADSEAGGNKKTAKAKELACLAVFIVTILLTVNGVAHFITMQGTVKSQVRPEALTRIQELKQMFGNEDTQRSYLHYVSEMGETYNNAIKKNYADQGTIDVMMGKFNDEMRGYGEYDRLKKTASSFLYNCEYSVLNWFPWDVIEYLDQLDTNTQEWIGSLETLSMNSEWVQENNEPYNPHINASTNFKQQLANVNLSNYGPVSILIIILLLIMMLLQYVSVKDWSRSGPRRYKPTKGSGPRNGPMVYTPKENNADDSMYTPKQMDNNSSNQTDFV